MIASHLLLPLALLAAPPASVPADRLGRTVPVIGALGVPLGQVVTVTGVAVESRRRADEGKALIEVRSVEGRALEEPVTLITERFAFTHIPFPRVGEAVTYVAYETGGFRGIPAEAFKHIPRVATAAYAFATRLQLCKLTDAPAIPR